MLQFKNGQFQEIDAKSVIHGIEGLDADAEEIKGAGFGQWEMIGDRGLFSIEIWRRYTPETQRTEWYLYLSTATDSYPNIYCDSDADFMPLFLRLGPLATVAMMDVITFGIQEACDAIRRGQEKDCYEFSDLLVDLVER